jgi:hypothetical protein
MIYQVVLKNWNLRYFADDTNVFASASDLKSLEILMNPELEKFKEWCDVNKLSIKMSKTNFMIIKSPKKKNMSVDIHIKTKDGSCHSLATVLVFLCFFPSSSLLFSKK